MATKPNINVYNNNPNLYNLSNRGGTAIKYIAIHYTAGTGSAKNNCIYFSTGNRSASADFFIDPDGTIWQFNPNLTKYYTWEIGGGSSYGPLNRNTVGIEFVNTGNAFTTQQIKSGAALVQWLMSQFGVPAGNVVRHYDCNSIRKRCPAYYIDNGRWNTLRKQLTSGSTASTTPAPTAQSKPVTNASGNSDTIFVDGLWGQATTRKLQRAAGTTVDGEISNQPSNNKKYVPSAQTISWKFKSSNFSLGSSVVKQVQKKTGVGVDGFWGVNTSKGVQNYLIKKGYSCGKSGADGYFGPDSCKALQRCLNDGKFF